MNRVRNHHDGVVVAKGFLGERNERRKTRCSMVSGLYRSIHGGTDEKMGCIALAVAVAVVAAAVVAVAVAVVVAVAVARHGVG